MSKISFSKLLDIKKQAVSDNKLLNISGIPAILSDASNINIKNSNIKADSTKAIHLVNQNSIDITSSNINNTIFSNLNNIISNKTHYNNQHIITNIGNNTIYNLPGVNFKYNRSNNIDLNTTLFSGLPYISKPVYLKNDTPTFGSFNDSNLLMDTEILIQNLSGLSKISVIKVNDIELQQQNSILVDLAIFFKNLPRNLNGHKFIFNIKSTPDNYICNIQNIIGGSLIFNFLENNNTSFIISNCKNISIYSQNQNSIGRISFSDCKNINIDNIYCNNNNNNILPTWAKGNSALLYFQNSKAIISNTVIDGLTVNYGLTASNAKIYLKDVEFKNCRKNTMLLNFSMIDTNNKNITVQDYIDEIADGQNTRNDRIDGLYKHFHTQYIPSEQTVPVGATIGFPRVVNGKIYYDNCITNRNLYKGLLLSMSMENKLPSCYIPFDAPPSAYIDWRSQYADKFEQLSDTIYEPLTSYMKPFDSSEIINAYGLFFGKNASTIHFSEYQPNNIPDLFGEYTEQIQFLRDVELFAEQGIDYTISLLSGNTNIICDMFAVTNTVNIPTTYYPLTCGLNLKSIKDFFIYKCINPRLKAFFDLILSKSYINITIDNKKYTIPFNIINNQSKEEIIKIFKHIIIKDNIDGSSILSLSSVKVKFKKSISNIQIYYYGVPNNTNCDKIIFAGGKSDIFNTIKQFKWIKKPNIIDGEQQPNASTNTVITESILSISSNKKQQIGTMKLAANLPFGQGYYQFYADTILCFYNNKLDNSIGGLGNMDALIQKTDKSGLNSNRIFRRVADVYNNTKNYIYISGSVLAGCAGLYKRDSNSSIYKLINSNNNNNNYNISVSENTYTLSELNEIICTCNVGTNREFKIQNDTYIFYSSAHNNNLSSLYDIMPSAIIDINDNIQLIPSKYLETRDLNGITYGYIPSQCYNFDFSRQSVNGMVSGYFRIKEKGKLFLDAPNYSNRILFGTIDGAQSNLNALYNALYNLNTHISKPLYEYSIANTTYQIYPFDAQSSLSTTTYCLNSSLIQSNALFSTLNRITDVMTIKHSTVRTDNIKETRSDILFADIYPSAFCEKINERLIHKTIEPNIMDSYGMYWPISSATDDLSSYHTCIPFIKYNINANDEFIVANNNMTIDAYPFGNIDSSHTHQSLWYPYLNNTNLKCQHIYNKLPLVYKLPNSNAKITLKYTGYIQIPINVAITKCTVNDIEYSVDEISNGLINTRNVVVIYYKNTNNFNQCSVFIVPKSSGLTPIKSTTLKYKILYSYEDEISFSNTEYAEFKNAYNNVIYYAARKVKDIWNSILINCRNQASFMTYSTIYNNDIFLYRTNSKSIDLNKIDSTIDYETLFNVTGDAVKYFNIQNNYENNIFNSNYALSSIIPQLFNK